MASSIIASRRSMRQAGGRWFPRRHSSGRSTASCPTGDGWFVLNAREARWWSGEGRGALTDFEGGTRVPAVRNPCLGPRPGRADVDVPLGGRPGGLPRPVRRGAPARRGRGAPAAAVGLRALPARHEPQRSSAPATGRASCSQSARASTRTALAGAATPSTKSRSDTTPASSSETTKGGRGVRAGP